MKNMKRFFALALALIMVLGLATTAFAAENVDEPEAGTETPAPNEITISVVTSASGASVAGHTYEVYQIFTGDVAEGNKLSNVAFGLNYTPADITVDDAIAALSAMTGAAAAEYLQGQLNNEDPFAVLNDDNNHQIKAPTGYYLIIDVSTDLPENESVSAFILQALEDVAIKSKHDSEFKTYKKIDDVNDSTGEGIEIEWHDSADHDIGDLIKFQLNAVIPSTIDAFRANDQEYPFTFHDVESAGLTFSGITEVYVLNGTAKTAITSGYTLVKSATDGCTFEVKFEDLAAIEAVKSGSILVVEYQSELNENAIIGSAGNPNKMRGEFENYNNPDHPSFTPWDTVIAFTYKLESNKYADKVQEGNELTGAGFTLFKWIKNNTEEGGEWVQIGEEVKGEEMTKFEWKGIDDGKYKLVETTTPAGYNTIDPIEFEVVAAHVIVADNPTLTDLTGETKTGEIEFTADKSNGLVSTDVVNKSGTVLPETGGMGTTMFYVIGGLLVAASVILLVTKKRMASVA